MEWIFDPTVWAGLAALILLELVLGIDNLVFIAILVQKLPEDKRVLARNLGLGLALFMRVVFLAGISWLETLTEPFISLFGFDFSSRDLVLLFGGLFLICKATVEIHDRLEGRSEKPGKTFKAQFWMIVAQIVILDAVFSLDSVITAVGMADQLAVMVLAVALAMAAMLAVGRRLTDFVGRHPTVVMLCLGFLLMVGFSLVVDGFGLHIPKGYLYAAIAFSIMIEVINQLALAKLNLRVRRDEKVRQKTADIILKVLGAKPADDETDVQEAGMMLQEAAKTSVLSSSEKELLRGVLNLSERPVHTIMTPRMDVEYIDIKKPAEEVFAAVRDFGRSHILVVDGELDNVLGILRRDDFLRSCIDSGHYILSPKILHEPVFVQKQTSVISLLELFKNMPVELAVVIDEFGMVEGVVSHLDLLEAIAGEFPDRDEPEAVSIAEKDNGVFEIDGMASIYDVTVRLGVDYTPDGRFATIAGLLLHEMGRVPVKGDVLEWFDWVIKVEAMDGRRVDKVVAVKKQPSA